MGVQKSPVLILSSVCGQLRLWHSACWKAAPNGAHGPTPSNRKVRTMRLDTRIFSSVLAAAAMTVAGCGSATDDMSDLPARPESSKEASAKADQWNSANNPARLGIELEYKLDALPKAGRAEHVPWPETYWPTYMDSYNVRWNTNGATAKDKLSPAEKYDAAFNGWTPDDAFLKLKPFDTEDPTGKWDKDYYTKLGPAAKYCSQNEGNMDAHDGKDSDGDGKTDEKDDDGFDGIETWWGKCHAWVPAALLEEEPIKPVTYNGITFEVSDIKALLISQYDSTDAVMLGGRCNDKEIKRDPKTGKPVNIDCGDTNPGTWHVVMANLLGKMHKPLAEDRTANYEVWNQPIIEWKVDSMKEVSEAEALKILNRTDTKKYSDINKDWAKLYDVKATSRYITESYPGTEPYTPIIEQQTRDDHYHYILEIDKNGKINGGEWAPESQEAHPDFLWMPTAANGGNPNIELSQVRMLLEKSRSTNPAPTPDDPSLKVYKNENPFNIPDNKTAGVTSTINVPDSVKIAKLEVEVNITHTYIGDVKVVLKKGTKKVTLQDQVGGSAANLKKTFTVTGWDTKDAKGTWSLTVSDTADGDTGKLVSWKMKIAAVGSSSPTPTPTGGTVTGASTAAVAIKDNDPTGVTSTIKIADSKTIKNAKITVKINYSYIGALVVEARHGSIKALLAHNEGGSGTSIDKTFEVNAFNGASTSGDWTLTVIDGDAYGDSGNLESWNVELSY